MPVTLIPQKGAPFGPDVLSRRAAASVMPVVIDISTGEPQGIALGPCLTRLAAREP